jgi:adenylyltransferase/sulfurtransferase
VIDLREPEEIALAPLPELPSQRIPSGQVVAHAQELAHGRLLLICASGRRSGHAARLLRAEGIRQAYSLAGGLYALPALPLREKS